MYSTMISDTMGSAGFGHRAPGDTKLGERTPAESVAGFRMDLTMNRRNFLSTAAATAGLALATPVFGKKTGSSSLSHKERVDRALRGQDLDRPPFTFYHHYKRPAAQLEAQDHLEFHRTYNTDIVKVMNDFDYPQSKTGKWYELKPLASPFPHQLATLRLCTT